MCSIGTETLINVSVYFRAHRSAWGHESFSGKGPLSFWPKTTIPSNALQPRRGGHQLGDAWCGHQQVLEGIQNQMQALVAQPGRELIHSASRPRSGVSVMARPSDAAAANPASPSWAPTAAAMPSNAAASAGQSGAPIASSWAA